MSQGEAEQQQVKGRLQNWQTVLAAAITAVATLVVALIATHSDGPKITAKGSNNSLVTQPRIGYHFPGTAVTINSVIMDKYSHPERESLVFRGTVFGWRKSWASFAGVFVIGERPEAGMKSGGRWLVSPAATVIDGRKWIVHWMIPHPPIDEKWVAILMLGVNNNGGPNDNRIINARLLKMYGPAIAGGAISKLYVH